MSINAINIRADLDRLSSFPAMPELAKRVMELGADPEVNDLVAVVELDPGIAAQVVRQATSPFFGYRGTIKSVRDAITRVLGMDRAVNLILGVAVGKALRSPADGPVGRKAIWIHAAYSAALCQALAESLPKEAAVSPGMCYLGGLMHNIGFLLLGHLYPADLHALNKTIAENPGVSIITLERRLFSFDHTEIGMWLMEKWGMPAEILTAVHRHHQVDYRSDHAIYANVTLLSDRLLRRLDLGDGDGSELPPELLGALGLEEAETMGALQRLLESRSDLDNMAKYLATGA